VSPLLQVWALLLLGSTAVRLALTDDHLRFVKSSLAPFLLLVGVALCLLGAAVAYLRSREPQPAPGDEGHDHAGDHAGGHAGDHPGPRIGLLLLLPVAVVYVVAPPPLGSFAAERTAVREPTKVEASVPLPDIGPDGYRRATMADYTARPYWDVTPTYEGEPVRLVGFVTPRAGGGWYLTRMQIACCAADGFPIKVLVRDRTGSLPPPRESWVQVDGIGVGSVSEDLREEDALGEVIAERVTPVPAPASPYEEALDD
jgi:uncharacterized repeat protein (TIGR03943 family)